MMINLQIKRIKLLDILALAAYCVWIYWLSDQSSLTPPIDFGFQYQDKLYHSGAYFIMGLIAWRGFNALLSNPVLVVMVSAAFCSLYGISDEWHQSFVEGRSPDIFDWLADTTGAVLAALFMQQLSLSVTKNRWV